MELDHPAATVCASVLVAVTRDATGDLHEGATARLAAVDGVAAVEALDVTGVRPTLNDLRVEAEAVLALDPPDADSTPPDRSPAAAPSTAADPSTSGDRSLSPDGGDRPPDRIERLLEDGFGVLEATVE